MPGLTSSKTWQKNKKNQTQKSNQIPQHCKPRKSYHFTRELVPVDGFYVQKDTPRKSSRRRNFRSSNACSSRETVWSKADSPMDYSASSSSLSSSDVDAEKIDKLPELQLPPAKFDGMKTKRNNRDKNMSPVRKFSVGVRLRTHSPRIRSRRLIHGRARKSVSPTSSSSSSRVNALAVVKSSFDPELDFRESMVEMIVENNIRTSQELEDLLACYLSLNSDDYHQVIIKVFKQIWFDLNHVHFNY